MPRKARSPRGKKGKENQKAINQDEVGDDIAATNDNDALKSKAAPLKDLADNNAVDESAKDDEDAGMDTKSSATPDSKKKRKHEETTTTPVLADATITNDDNNDDGTKETPDAHDSEAPKDAKKKEEEEEEEDDDDDDEDDKDGEVEDSPKKKAKDDDKNEEGPPIDVVEVMDLTKPIKRARTAYFIFSDERRAEIQAKVRFLFCCCWDFCPKNY